MYVYDNEAHPSTSEIPVQIYVHVHNYVCISFPSVMREWREDKNREGIRRRHTRLRHTYRGRITTRRIVVQKGFDSRTRVYLTSTIIVLVVETKKSEERRNKNLRAITVVRYAMSMRLPAYCVYLIYTYIHMYTYTCARTDKMKSL